MAPNGAHSERLLLVMTPAPRAMCPRILVLFFLLSPVQTYYIAEEIYYKNGDIRCLRCLPGTYVKKPCTTEEAASTCAPCNPGSTYSEHLTGLPNCLPCTICRTDEEEVSQCTVTKNSICRCKKGTYCPPGDPCEICLKCTTSCPPDQVEHAPCNSTSDMQCGPPETASISSLAIALPIVIGIILSGVFVGLYCCKKNCDRSQLINGFKPKILSLSSNYDQASPGDSETPFLPQRPKLHFKKNITENEKNEVVNKTFNVFLDNVPPNDFEKFVRELGLPGNYIEWAKRDNVGAYNQQYEMLSRLNQDKKFDVNIWLYKLQTIKLGKTAKDITEELIRDGLFEKSSEA